MKDRVKRIAERFTEIADKGEVEKAVKYFERVAVFDTNKPPRQRENRELRTPPMNELYKGVKA